MALVSSTLDELKRGLEAWKLVLESKGLIANVKRTKMIISEKNAGQGYNGSQVSSGKFICAVCIKM